MHGWVRAGAEEKSSAGRDPGPGHHNPEHATSKGVVRAQDVTCGKEK